jgi:ribosome-associated protein
MDYKLKQELHFSFARSSGPGGQNVNKVNSKVILHWNVLESKSVRAEVKDRFLQKFKNKINDDGEVVIASESHRDQLRNREACIEKLEKMLAQVLLPPKKRLKTKPSRSAKEKRLKSKITLSKKKSTRTKPNWREE